MFRSISNVPIFRRLFIAFALTAAIPGIVIVLLGSYYINSLTLRGQVVKTTFDAQNTAFEQQINLQRMNALLQTRFYQVLTVESGFVKDASLEAATQLTNSYIVSRQINFDQTLTQYQDNFNLSSSPNMDGIRTILLSDNASNGKLISDQAAAFNQVIKFQCPQYQR